MTSPDPRAALADELLPCPFCNSANVEMGHTETNWPAVQCNNCGVLGPCTDLHSSEAIAAWNTRSPSPYSGALELADRMENHVVSRLPAKAPVVENGAWQMMLDAAKLLRGLPTTLPRDAERETIVLQALEFYADPFAWKKKHDPDNVLQIPDFYSETSFGDTALEALACLSPSIPSREGLSSVALKIAEKISQLRHYRDNECQLDHARAIAEGRILQAEMDLRWVREALSPSPTPVMPDEGKQK